MRLFSFALCAMCMRVSVGPLSKLEFEFKVYLGYLKDIFQFKRLFGDT